MWPFSFRTHTWNVPLCDNNGAIARFLDVSLSSCLQLIISTVFEDTFAGKHSGTATRLWSPNAGWGAIRMSTWPCSSGTNMAIFWTYKFGATFELLCLFWDGSWSIPAQLTIEAETLALETEQSVLLLWTINHCSEQCKCIQGFLCRIKFSNNRCYQWAKVFVRPVYSRLVFPLRLLPIDPGRQQKEQLDAERQPSWEHNYINTSPTDTRKSLVRYITNYLEILFYCTSCHKPPFFNPSSSSFCVP